jgi:DNA primase
MHFDDEFIDEVKRANPLIETMSEYTNIERKGEGGRYKCNCPLPNHEDKKTPSMTIFDNDSAYCFGCDTNIMDSIALLEQMEGLSFPEAVIKLAERAGLEIPSEENEKFKRVRSQREDMMQKARVFYNNLMNKKEYSFAKDYLMNERGLTKEVIDKYKLGYCNRDFLNDDEYRKFTNRIIFPVFNHYGEICGFSGRSLPKDEGKYAKYVNSSEKYNDLFKKKKLIYGLDLAKKSIRTNNFVIWFEGYMDVASAHKVGVENVVASMGTAITEEQIKLMSRFTKNIILFLDGDDSGVKAIHRSLDLFDKQNILLKIVHGKNNMDPDDMANIMGAKFKDWILKNAKTPEQFFANKYLEEFNLEVNEAQRKAIENVAETFGNRLDRIETEIALSSLSNSLGISIETLKKKAASVSGGG